MKIENGIFTQDMLDNLWYGYGTEGHSLEHNIRDYPEISEKVHALFYLSVYLPMMGISDAVLYIDWNGQVGKDMSEIG